jgi:ribosomal protein S18 acetylase RimI-like enzyme
MGIGTAVLKRLLEEAGRDGHDLTLSVVAANTRARRFYERLGFEVVGLNKPFIRIRYRASMEKAGMKRK